MTRIISIKNITAMIFILLGYILLQKTYEERAVTFFSSDELGSMTYPRYLLWAWLALSVGYLFTPKRNCQLSDLKKAAATLFISLLLVSGYVVLFKYTGLTFSTCIFLMSFIYLLGYRQYIKLIGVAAFSSFAVWYIFEKLLNVVMPTSLF